MGVMASLSDLISVRPHLSGVRVLGVLVDSVDRSMSRYRQPGVVAVRALWVPLFQGVGSVPQAGP